MAVSGETLALLLIVAVNWALAVGVLAWFANRRNQSPVYALWGLIGILGVALGVWMMRREPRRGTEN
jgi:multidrug transporter EmrE-like cation transporter